MSYFNANSKSSYLPYLFTMVAASLMTTYIELWFTAQNHYIFLTRPFPTVFPIDIRLTLIVIPLFTFIALWIMKSLQGMNRFSFILLTSLLAMLLEPVSEQAGWVAFSPDWKHLYSFFGYAVFLLLIRRIHVIADR
ncbi:CBO0543 family protein [Halobacillus litoralis]|uniref:CBO0543 family protein n=1 Tax=Halobacillus litoralis TaxID=45668 RepID=UPI0024906AF9|nr:CBO0543 family protein [Halobacillus litoralis]